MEFSAGRRARALVAGAAATLLALVAQPEAARAETLADAMAHGYEASGLLEQNRALLRAADEGVATAVSALLPVVSWSLNAQTQFPQQPFSDFITGGLQISAELTLYDGGRNQLALDGLDRLGGSLGLGHLRRPHREDPTTGPSRDRRTMCARAGSS